MPLVVLALLPQAHVLHQLARAFVIRGDPGGLLVSAVEGVDLVAVVQRQPRAVRVRVQAVEDDLLAGAVSVQLQPFQLTEVGLVEELFATVDISHEVLGTAAVLGPPCAVEL